MTFKWVWSESQTKQFGALCVRSARAQTRAVCLRMRREFHVSWSGPHGHTPNRLVEAADSFNLSRAKNEFLLFKAHTVMMFADSETQ